MRSPFLPLVACLALALLTVPGFVATTGAQPRAGAPASSVDLLARFERQPPAVYEVELLTENTLELGSVTQEYTGRYQSRVSIVLERSNNELTTVRLTHDRIRVSFEGRGGGPGVPMGSYDSESPDAPGTTDEYRQIVQPLVGKPLLIDLLPTGEIAAVRGLAQLAPPGPAGHLFREMFTEQTFRDMYGWIFALKSEPSTAEPGESWTIVQSANNPLGTLRRVHELRLESVSGPIAAISITGRNDLQGSVPGMFESKAPAGAPMVRGEAQWDIERRQVATLNTTSKTHVESTTPGMGIKMIVNAQTTVRRVDR